MIVENQIVLKAEEGKLLTNGDTFGTIVYLAKNDNADNWYEITIKEYQETLKSQEEIIE